MILNGLKLIFANAIVERTRAGLAAARKQGRVGGVQIMTEDVMERCHRMLHLGATRRQVADVIGVEVKTIYKYFPVTVRDQGFQPFPCYVTFERKSAFSFENSLVCS